MPQKRGIATDQLTNVLQVIQLGRKTGLLTVERGEGPGYEVGEMTFHHGQITYVTCGRLEGKQALNWLQSWGPCRFVFVNSNGSSSSEPTTGPISVQESSPTGTSASLAALRRDTHPIRSSAMAQPSSPSNTMLTDPRRPAYPPNQGGSYSNVPPYTSGLLIPQRTCPADEGMKLLTMANLSRQHRQFYLLIDGQRSGNELARLMGRSLDEVLYLLNDLINIGIIRY